VVLDTTEICPIIVCLIATKEVKNVLYDDYLINEPRQCIHYSK